MALNHSYLKYATRSTEQESAVKAGGVKSKIRTVFN